MVPCGALRMEGYSKTTVKCSGLKCHPAAVYLEFVELWKDESAYKKIIITNETLLMERTLNIESHSVLELETGLNPNSLTVRLLVSEYEQQVITIYSIEY